MLGRRPRGDVDISQEEFIEILVPLKGTKLKYYSLI